MSSPVPKGRIQSTLRQFLDAEASGGIVLMAVAVLAIVTANSALAPVRAIIPAAKAGPNPNC